MNTRHWYKMGFKAGTIQEEIEKLGKLTYDNSIFDIMVTSLETNTGTWVSLPIEQSTLDELLRVVGDYETSFIENKVSDYDIDADGFDNPTDWNKAAQRISELTPEQQQLAILYKTRENATSWNDVLNNIGKFEKWDKTELMYAYFGGLSHAELVEIAVNQTNTDQFLDITLKTSYANNMFDSPDDDNIVFINWYKKPKLVG